jgi:hypothetical protein
MISKDERIQDLEEMLDGAKGIQGELIVELNKSEQEKAELWTTAEVEVKLWRDRFEDMKTKNDWLRQQPSLSKESEILRLNMAQHSIDTIKRLNAQIDRLNVEVTRTPRAVVIPDGQPYMFLSDAVAKARELAAVLRSVEWRQNHAGTTLCNSCGGLKHQGHISDCKLAAALVGFPEDPQP